MDLQKIKALIDIAANSKLSELEWDEGEYHLRIVRGEASANSKALTSATRITPPVTVSAPAPAPQPSAPALEIAQAHTVTAPMFGVFCLRPAPTEAPFVQLGDMVKKGQKICMLEAMKLFHSLESDRAGRVVEILVEHGQEVDAGQPLLRIE